MTEAKRSERAIYDENLELEENARELARSNCDLEAFGYSFSHVCAHRYAISWTCRKKTRGRHFQKKVSGI
jgi:hypothetical protein